MNTRLVIFLAIFSLACGASFAAKVTLAPADLNGKWVVGLKQDCGSGASVNITFRDNGTVEIDRGTKPLSVGFWSINDAGITLHTLVAPGESDESNVFYYGKYTYSYLTAEVIEASDSAVEIITGTTGNTKRSTLTRCD
jgi:hypothetical protein